MSVFELANYLENKGAHFQIERYRSDSITFLVTVVSYRLEIDVFEDGHLEIAKFSGDESILGGEEIIDDFFGNYDAHLDPGP